MTYKSFTGIAVVGALLLVGGILLGVKYAPAQPVPGIQVQAKGGFGGGTDLEFVTQPNFQYGFMINGAQVFGQNRNISVTQIANTGFLTIGANASSSQITGILAATSTVNQFTLGAITVATSTASTTITFSLSAATPTISVGDPCAASLSTAPATAFDVSFNISTSTASAATGTAVFWNGINSVVTVATGTLRVACMHLGI